MLDLFRARLLHLLVVLLAFLGGALIALVVLPRPAARLLQATGEAQVGGPFALTDHTGKRVTDQDFRGRILLVFFGFTLCPDICPAGLQTMAAALDELGPQADKVAPIFITFDPEHDTPAELSDYVKAFSPRLIGLTGTPRDIAAIANAYHVYFQRLADPKSSAGYTIDHTANFFVMAADGKYVTHLQHLATPHQIATRLKQLF